MIIVLNVALILSLIYFIILYVKVKRQRKRMENALHNLSNIKWQKQKKLNCKNKFFNKNIL